jgi:hypothetical protein
MTSQELLLALADEETLELARKMIGKLRLAFFLAKQAIGPEAETSLDAEEVAQILGVHKRHAYRLIKSATCQTNKKSQSSHKRITNRSQKSHNMSQPEAPKRHVSSLPPLKPARLRRIGSLALPYELIRLALL